MSKIAEKIAGEVLAHGFVYQWNKGSNVSFADAVDRVLEGKIISKSEVDALRKDAANMQSAQDAYNYADGLNQALRRARQLFFDRAWDFEKDAIAARVDVVNLKNKLWDAEQEIHDLKNEVDSQSHDIGRLELEIIDEMEENDRVTDGWEAEVQAGKREIEYLKKWIADTEVANNINLTKIADLQRELTREKNPDIATATKRWVDAVGWKSSQQLFQEAVESAETIEPPSCLKPADAINWTSTQVYGGSENNKTADLMKNWISFKWHWNLGRT